MWLRKVLAFLVLTSDRMKEKLGKISSSAIFIGFGLFFLTLILTGSFPSLRSDHSLTGAVIGILPLEESRREKASQDVSRV